MTEIQGEAGRGVARRGGAWQGQVGRGSVRRGRARRGRAGQGMASLDPVLAVVDEFYRAMTGRSMMRYPTGGKRGDLDARIARLVVRPHEPAADGLTRVPGCG
jgi:hypothetical protein